MSFERESRLRETLVERKVVHRGKYLTLATDTVRDSDGGQHSREIVIHPGAVAVVALTADGRVLLVRQYRHAASEVLLEIPAGTLDVQADGSIEETLPAAKRELCEETGYRAQTWRLLATFFTAPGFATELMTVYLATDLEQDPNYDGPEPDERLEQVDVAFDDAIARARNGQIRDAKTLIGLYTVESLARAGEVAELPGLRAR
jgi:ADP-ribose pyrophosphatase